MRISQRGSGVRAYGPWLAVMAILLQPGVAGAADAPTVRVTRPGAGRVVLEVSDATVAVRKDITADSSVVTVTTGQDRLTIAVRRGQLSVNGPGGGASLDGRTGADADRLLVVLQRSNAAAQARKLLAQITEGPDTFVGQSLLLTRAILEVGSGSVDALNRHQRWVAETAASLAAKPGASRGRPALVRVNWEVPPQRTPGECWDIYSKEAVRIAEDFEDCTDDLKWYEAHLWAGCSLIYAVRSEGAMAWYISCNGGVPFHG